MGKFGKTRGAVGAAIGVNRVMSALNKRKADTVAASLVFAEKGAEGLAYDTAYNLRVNGCLVEMYIGEHNIDTAKAYAAETGAACMLRVCPDGKLFIYDFEKNDIIKTTVNEFLGYSEEAAEPTPQQLGFRSL